MNRHHAEKNKGYEQLKHHKNTQFLKHKNIYNKIVS